MSTPLLSRKVLLALATLLIAVNPTTGQERGEKRGPGRGRGGPSSEGESDLSKAPLPKDEAEKKILAVLDEIMRDRSRQFRNVSPIDGRFMRQITEAAGAKRVVEIGMSTGYSALWFALALKSTGGKLITHEMDAGRIKKAQEHFKKAGVEDLITIIEGNAHETVQQHKEPIDVLFLDADKEGYIDYLDKLLPLIRPGGVILAHNMRRPRADPKFLEAITTNPNLDTIFVLMEGAGISMTLKKR